MWGGGGGGAGLKGTYTGLAFFKVAYIRNDICRSLQEMGLKTKILYFAAMIQLS
jgi:hypothetical protein